MTDSLLEALEELVPYPREAEGDWDAALAAAQLPSHRPSAPRPTRRQLVAALAVLVAVAVIVATPAFGLRGLILGLVDGKTSVSFYRSTPAPPEIKMQFLDFGLGAPRTMRPEVLPAQAKQITLITPMDERRIIWVAPARGGGFCSVGGISGGCVTRAIQRRNVVTVAAAITAGHGAVTVRQVGGQVFSPKVSSLTLEFADGDSLALPFVFISSPIDAGFYALGLPPAHQQRGHWPVRVVARDAHGRTLGTATLATPAAPFAVHPRFPAKPLPPRTLPPATSVRPAAPVQRAAADGVTFTAGANGAVQLTARGVPAATAHRLAGSITVSCFRLTREFGIPDVRGSGVSGAFAPSIGFVANGVGRPLDGCEVDSARGHRWPDALGSHSPVEVAFTARGRAYFADRAAARDLALFVRSGRVQRIRKEAPRRAVPDLAAAFGPALAHSRIRYAAVAGGIRFSETSTTGRTFGVVVRGGRIARENLKPYAKVF